MQRNRALLGCIGTGGLGNVACTVLVAEVADGLQWLGDSAMTTGRPAGACMCSCNGVQGPTGSQTGWACKCSDLPEVRCAAAQEDGHACCASCLVFL